MEVSNLTWNWLAFEDHAIKDLPERVEGVYFIIDGERRAVYVGEAEDIRARLTQHLHGTSDQAPCIHQQGGVEFAFWPVSGGKHVRVEVEQALLEKYPTPCNG